MKMAWSGVKLITGVPAARSEISGPSF